ncbi:hypothetical protein [Methylobacterium nigriterrae]|uniref:hypothetical protein n=1 Tax=Methylobacterium nigriterrae TaxID=3127512 RepID=UPI003013239C
MRLTFLSGRCVGCDRGFRGVATEAACALYPDGAGSPACPSGAGAARCAVLHRSYGHALRGLGPEDIPPRHGRDGGCLPAASGRIAVPRPGSAAGSAG